MATRRNVAQQERESSLLTCTPAMLAAADLLASGKSDTDAADAVGVNRGTVWRWRQYHPGFKSELARRRESFWNAAVDRLRSLLPAALDALAEELTAGDRLKAAGMILKHAGLEPRQLPNDGHLEPDRYVSDATSKLARQTAGERWHRDIREPTDNDIAAARRAVVAELAGKLGGDLDTSLAD